VPRPRFARLPAEKKAAILEAAALEFGALGFADASINHILEVAGISKGAAYYYFDDKEDLFLTVVRHFSAQLGIDDLRDLADQLTAEKFWSGLAELFRIPLASSFESPTAFGVLRAAGELWRTKPQGEGPLAALAEEQLGFLSRLFERGQRLGVIRTDVPQELLLAWTRALDDANDRWMLEHWHELDRAGLMAAADRLVDAIRRLASPQPTTEEHIS